MIPRSRLNTSLLLSIVFMLSAGPTWAEHNESPTSSSTGQSNESKKTGVTGKVKHAATATGHFIEKVATKTGQALQTGAEKTGEAIGTAVHWTESKLENVGQSIKDLSDR